MKNQSISAGTSQPTSLHYLIGKLLPAFQQEAVQHKSFFVNDVPENIMVSADKQVLASVLGNLLTIVSRNSDNSCIRVSAKTYHDIVLLHVKDNNTCNNYALNAGLASVQPQVNRIGGFIDITSQHQRSTTIAFSFSNLPGIAA